ncbi:MULTISPECIES: hypothetical protein [Vibrio]|uniref:hypothetical protein n=1 Tax=Vibrio TaxID=662 RepID=UPI00215BFDDF|nr:MULTISPECIES: hypothetical protein [Vibrio]MCR9641820.1 hypothetical protein [Vibrio alginolyticus]MDW1579741.1 hypothetical protein [Vibrio sp. Vb2897]MDW1585896.1 hypothetical protein [Vibrio sp. Vb2910]MDW1594807.1 hypothetical protein [Vibrio sp. Vb2911]MDW1638002.1 hypothetical protein [Vibrio sp. Vb2896]
MHSIDLAPKKLLEAHMCLFALFAPLSVTQWNKIFLVILFLSSLLAFSYYLINSKTVSFEKYPVFVCLSFSSVFIISLFSILISRDYLVAEYLRTVIIGRMFTFFALMLNVIIFLLWISNATESSLKKFMKLALLSVLAFIALGYWQVIGKFLGIPFFIETRDWMHGVPAALRAVFPSRVTSIAEEPNYLSPILMESLILITFLVRHSFSRLVLLLLSFGIVILSFSGGAYVNFVLLLGFVFVFTFLKTVLTGKTRISHFFILVIVMVLVLLLIYVGTILIEFIYYKMSTEASGGSSRSQFMISFVQLITESNYTQLIFGHGLGTMSVLDEFGMKSEDYLFRITNNYILDMFWESGAIGVLMIFTFFMSLFYPCFKYGFTSVKYFLGGLLTFHLLIASTYRSEYLSTHFAWIVFLILCIYKLAELERAEKLISKNK